MYLSFKNIIFLLVISASILIAQSGTVKTLTDKAIEEYQNGDYSAAISDMEQALDIMKQKQGNELNSLLPQTLPGWTRGESSSQPMDPRGIMGGHVVEQTYNKGNGFVTATLILEAPMVNDVRSTLNTPQSSQNINDGIIESISNKKAFVRYHDNEKQGEISMLASSTTVAVVYGKNVTLRELKNYAKLFNFSEISKIK